MLPLSRQEAEKAQKQADKYQKRMNELAPMIKNMEKLAADFSADPEQTLPKAVAGSEQVNAVISRAKRQEQIEAEQKRAQRQKMDRGGR